MSEKTGFFEKQNVMKTFAILATIFGFAAGIVYYFVDGAPDVQHIIFAIQGILAFFLYYAYKRHDKNVMKGLLGSLLTILIVNELISVYAYFLGQYAVADKLDPFVGYLYLLVKSLLVAVQGLIFLTHFIINADHHSSPALVKFNQVLLVSAMILIICQELFGFFALGIYSWGYFIAQLCWFILEISSYGVVVCIESKLDAFRILREAKAANESKNENEN